METPWYKISNVASASGFFRNVGKLFNSTFNAMFTSAGTDLFGVLATLILFGLVAGFLLQMIRASKK